MDCFVASLLAMTNGSIPAARFRARVLQFVSPLETEGAGNAGCTPHPLPYAQNKKDARRPTQVRRNHSGTPCAMVYCLLRALAGDRAFLPPSPVEFDRLDPSVGGPPPRDLTI